MNTLPEIRDVHIPEMVSMFPLAYCWWVILGFIICLFVVTKIILLIIRTGKKYYALKELKSFDSLSDIDAVIGISNLLRRISAMKNKENAALYGKDWIDFLTNKKKSLSKDAADLLVYAPFMDKNSKNYNSKHVNEIKTFCKKWIGDNL